MASVSLSFSRDVEVVLPRPDSHRTRAISRRIWPSSLVLGQWLVNHSDAIAGSRVVDLGSGSGISGLVAAKSGAGHVILQDMPGDVETIKMQNELFQVNGVSEDKWCQLDLMWGECPRDPIAPVDYLISSDTFYEKDCTYFTLFAIDL